MRKLWNFIGLVIFVWRVCSALESDYEYEAGEPIDGSSLEVYRYTVLEPERYEDAPPDKDDVRKKRERVTTLRSIKDEEPASEKSSPPPKVHLSDLIGTVEGSIVQSALSVVTFVKTTQNSTDAPHSTVGDKEDPPQHHKRSAFSTDEVASDSDTIFKYVTTRSIPASEDQPPHYIVDQVAVSKARSAITPLIASLDFHVEKIHESTISSTPDSLKGGSIRDSSNSAVTVGEITVDDVKVTTFVTPVHAAESTTPSSLTKNTSGISASEEIVKITPKTSITETSAIPSSSLKEISLATSSSTTSSTPLATSSSTTFSTPNSSSSTTTVSSLSVSTSSSSVSAASTSAASIAASSTTSSTSTSTSTKTPIEKLKEAEEDLKEKVAEIEAEPIILSARV